MTTLAHVLAGAAVGFLLGAFLTWCLMSVIIAANTFEGNEP